MYLARVIGTCVATVKTPGLHGLRLLVVQPLDFLGGEDGRPFVAADTLGAAPGQTVFYVTSREAAKALPDPFNPVDATVMGLVDSVEYDPWRGGTA